MSSPARFQMLNIDINKLKMRWSGMLVLYFKCYGLGSQKEQDFKDLYGMWRVHAPARAKYSPFLTMGPSLKLKTRFLFKNK